MIFDCVQVFCATSFYWRQLDQLLLWSTTAVTEQYCFVKYIRWIAISAKLLIYSRFINIFSQQESIGICSRKFFLVSYFFIEMVNWSDGKLLAFHIVHDFRKTCLHITLLIQFHFAFVVTHQTLQCHGCRSPTRFIRMFPNRFRSQIPRQTTKLFLLFSALRPKWNSACFSA